MEYEKEIYARYDRKTIRVYQAYNSTIAEEAVRLQNFGDSFNFNRMTWIKPSFLWMMFRSNWGTAKNQECILAIDIDRAVFDSIVERAVLTSPDSDMMSGKEWEKAFGQTSVYCQWDPDRSIKGAPINRAAIQLGMRGAALRDFLDKGIISITDITPQVKKWNSLRKCGKLRAEELPSEKLYPVEDRIIRRRLDMKIN